MALRIISRQVVKPYEPTWNGVLPLTELDHISVISHTSFLYFYEKPTSENWLNKSNNKILNTLKNSLSHILVPFYPLAGRLSWIRGGQRRRLVLECNSMGAELIEAESNMSIADFGDFYSSNEKFQHLVPQMDYYDKPIHTLPVLVVQISKFVCGGVCVGISVSHVVVDGKSAFHFIEEWARIARGEVLKVEPFLDRQILLAKVDTNEYSITEDDVKNDVSYFNSLELGKKASPTFVLLSNDQIEQLKEVANSGRSTIDETRYTFSRFEVITAHVWRCVCKARELKGDDITSIYVLINARGRTDPPLPSSYFGNVVIDNKITSTMEKLISKPLSYACSMIRKASTMVTNEYVLEFIENLQKQPNLTKYQYIDDRGKLQGPSYGSNDVLAISWLNLAACGIDFGWGKEIYMGPPLVYGCDGDITIIPCKNDGSVQIVVCLQPKQKFQEYMAQLFPYIK